MNTLNFKKITDIPVIFFLGLYFLIFVCYLGSYLSSLNFLFTLQIGYVGSFLGKFLFLIFTCVYLINPQSGNAIYSTLTNSLFLEKICSLTLKLNNFTGKRPIFSFYLVYIYVLLLILHWFMLLFTEIDLYVEFLYNCFNIIRLLIFPLFIYTYIALYGPTSFKVVDATLTGNLSLEDAKKILNSSISFAKQALKLYPKSTKGGGIILGGLAVAQGGSMLYGTSIRNEINRTAVAPAVQDQIKLLSSYECLQDNNCQELLSQTMNLFRTANGSSMSLAYHDVKAVVSGDPTLNRKLETLVEMLPKINAEAYKNALKQKAAEIEWKGVSIEQTSNSTQIGQSSSSLLSTSQSAEAKAQLEELSKTSIVTLGKPSGPSSPLEEFWSFFFNNY